MRKRKMLAAPEWIPGVPAFHTGTGDGGLHHLPGGPTGGYPPHDVGVDPGGGGNEPQIGDTRHTPTPGGGVFVERWDGFRWVAIDPNDVFEPPTLPGTGGSGFSFDQREADLRLQLQRLGDEADIAIAEGDRLSVEKIEAQKRFLESLQLLYAKDRDEADRINQILQLSQAGRGQDISQRGQTIEGLLASSGQSLQGLTSAGNQLGQLAGLQQQRFNTAVDLSQDPVNFMGLLNFLGQGSNFIDRLNAGQTVGGPSVTTGRGDPLQGGFGSIQELLRQTKDNPYMPAGAVVAQRLADFQGPTLPDQIAPLGPEGVLTPDQAEIFRQFTEAAPDVPLDIRIAIARDPAAFRQGFGNGAPAPVEPQPGIPVPPSVPVVPPRPPGPIDQPTVPLEPPRGDRPPSRGEPVQPIPRIDPPTIPFGRPPTGGGRFQGLPGTNAPGGGVAGTLPDVSSLINPNSLRMTPERRFEQISQGATARQQAGQRGVQEGLLAQLANGGLSITPELATQLYDAGSPALAQRVAHLAGKGTAGQIVPPNLGGTPNLYNPLLGELGLESNLGNNALIRGLLRSFRGSGEDIEDEAAKAAENKQAERAAKFAQRKGPGTKPLKDKAAEDRAKFMSRLPSLAGGGDVLVNEPSVLLGLRSGRPIATMGEPTTKFPAGIPEILTRDGQVIPMAHGGDLITDRDADKRRRDQEKRQEIAAPPPIQPQPVAPPVVVQQPAPPPPTNAVLPTPTAPFGTGVTPATPGGVPAPQDPAPVEQGPGALLRRLFSLNPQSYYNLDPVEQDILFSIGRSLGVPESSARFSIERSFPRGIDPSRILTAGF